MIVDSADNIGCNRQCHEKRQKHITFKRGQCLKMLLQKATIAAVNKMQSLMGPMDHGIAKLTFRNGRPFSVIGGSIIRDVLTENINSQQLTQMVAI